MLAQHQLPLQLKLFLANKNILKVGRGVQGDLSYLQQACQSSTQFVGGIDLAQMAKDRHIITNTRSCSLSDLAAIVLRCNLPKNVSERVSQVWEDETLSDAAHTYAVLDVFASRMIYKHLLNIPIPGPLPAHPSAGDGVLVFNSDRTRIIASGSICPDPCGSLVDGVKLSPTRIAVEVNNVLVPGAIMNQHQKRTLESFGSVPFKVVCLRNHLRIATNAPPYACGLPVKEVPPSQMEDVVSAGELLAEEFDSSLDEAVGALVLDTASADMGGDDPAPLHVTDPQSLSEGLEILGDSLNQVPPLQLWSRVLKDAFHVFKMLYISRTHGIRIEFSRALRDAIFIPDKEDKQRIISWGLTQDPPQDWEFIRSYKSSWLWRHCKRTIPPPEQLHPLVAEVFRVYGPLKDAKTNLPLFNTAAWHAAKNILELIAKGFVSDPPGIALYVQIGIDKNAGGLPIYRCLRGTNMTEGGVHTHLRSRLPTSGVSVRHLLARLNDFTLHHNLLVCI